MYSGKQVYENDHPEADHWTDRSSTKSADRRPCNWKRTSRFLVVFTAMVIVGMLAYIVYRMETPRGVEMSSRDNITREIFLLRGEFEAVKTDFEKMPNMARQSDEMTEIIGEMKTMTQQLHNASQLKNQEIAKLPQEHAEMKTILNSVNDKLEVIGAAVNQTLRDHSEEKGGLKMKLEEVISESNLVRETLHEIKERMIRMQNQLQNVGNGSRSSSTPSGTIYICWIVVLYFLSKN